MILPSPMALKNTKRSVQFLLSSYPTLRLDINNGRQRVTGSGILNISLTLASTSDVAPSSSKFYNFLKYCNVIGKRRAE